MSKYAALGEIGDQQGTNHSTQESNTRDVRGTSCDKNETSETS